MVVLSRKSTLALGGLSIILIICHHFIGGGYNVRLFTPFGGIGVAIFLILSGYGISESIKTKGLGYYWENRFMRILVPYLLWLPCFWIIIGTTNLNCTLDVPFPRYWYLEYLLIWYLLCWILVKYIPKWVICGLAVFAILSFLLFPCLQAEQSFSFLLGFLASQKRSSLTKISKGQVLILALGLFVTGSIMLATKQLPMIRSFGENSILMKAIQLLIKGSFAISIIILLNLFEVSKSMNGVISALAVFGTYSLEMYLVQMVFWNDINHSLFKLSIYLIITVIISLLIRYLSKLIVSKIKNK